MQRRLTILQQYELYAGRVAALAAGVCALCVFLYGALLLGAVAHAAKHSAAQKQADTLSKNISALEAQYLSKTRVLTAQTAKDLGFVSPVAVSTVRITTPSLSFTGSR